MARIDVGPNLIQVDAGIVAKALQLTPQDLSHRMRDGTVTSLYERGEGEDAGRVRLTFFSATRRARITADVSGKVLSCTAVDFSRTPHQVQRSETLSSAEAASSRKRLDALLDAALEGSFPASDPIALSFD